MLATVIYFTGLWLHRNGHSSSVGKFLINQLDHLKKNIMENFGLHNWIYDLILWFKISCSTKIFYSFRFIEIYIWHIILCKFKVYRCWFYTLTYCKMINTIALANTSIKDYGGFYNQSLKFYLFLHC